MSLVITIDSNVIPDGDIRTYPVARNVAEYNNNLISSEMDIVLDNTDGSYSDTNVLSIFYGVNWVDKEVTVYDDVLELYTWKGRIKNLVQDDGNKTLTVKTANYVRDLVDITCVYSGSAITPAEAIYDILVDLIGVTASYIQYDGFQDAIARQTAESGTLVITFTADDNKSCMSVIQELLRLSNCVLYTVNNILHLWQWRAWDGVLGTRITDSEIIPGTFKSEYDFTTYNAYSVYWNNGGTATLRSVTKAGTSGEKKFVVPDENVETTTAASYRILLAAQAGADYYGVMAYTRHANPMKKCSFTLDDTMRDLAPNEQVDIDSGDFTGEPVRLTSVVYDPNNRTVVCEAIFLNLPVNVISRDETPPVSPALIEVLPHYKGLFLKWTQNTETDLLGYKVFISAGTPGVWRGLITNLGESPVDVRNPSLTTDGYCYKVVTELTPGATYYVKVRAYDTSFNESTNSNVLSGAALGEIDDLYCLTGSIYSGLTLDIDNTNAGTVPSGYMTYDDLDATGYDWDLFITASYQSGEHFSETGFDSMTWKSTSADIYLKYAESDDGVTWGAWSAEIDTLAASVATLTGKKYLKYIIIFYSNSWDDTDTIYIKEIEEGA